MPVYRHASGPNPPGARNGRTALRTVLAARRTGPDPGPRGRLAAAAPAAGPAGPVAAAVVHPAGRRPAGRLRLPAAAAPGVPAAGLRRPRPGAAGLPGPGPDVRRPGPLAVGAARHAGRPAGPAEGQGREGVH